MAIPNRELIQTACRAAVLGIALIAGACTDAGSDPRPTPAITAVQPDSAAAGDTVRAFGSGFGISRMNSSLTFGGTAASVFAFWTDQIVDVQIPGNAVSGPIVITVDGVASNAFPFTIRTSGEPSAVSFAGDVQPVLTIGCALSGCHRPPSPASGFDQSTYTGVRAGGQKFGSAVVAAGDSSTSRIIQAMRGTAPGLGRMPFGGPWVSSGVPDSLITTVARWIQEGALNN